MAGKQKVGLFDGGLQEGKVLFGVFEGKTVTFGRPSAG